ncbi:tannase/feruloyl esterase family alpha/beta hydrolase [Paraburkholderia sp. DGU8]|uniref:tannase/feruloyl esterase family alpha/beta hydrolase n=1 Tax=Paraburkholderia sp. DGU8 TaxID=3161997 RepID=UPI0034657CCE
MRTARGRPVISDRSCAGWPGGDWRGCAANSAAARSSESFVRFYEIARLRHAVGTRFNASWDSLVTLQNWVEHGRAPRHQVVTNTARLPGPTR